MKMFEVDDGAIHTVIAHNEAEAYGLWMESLIASGGDWPEEKPGITERESQKDFSLHLDGEKERIKLKVYQWCDLMQNPTYLGCSEF